MTRDRFKIKERNRPHFLTCTAVNWHPVFTRPKTVDILLESFEYLQKNGEWKLYGYVIMENHIHLIAASEALGNVIGRFKSFTARKIIDFLVEKGEKTMLDLLAEGKQAYKTDRRFQLWQDGNHPVAVKDDDMMRRALDYIHYNPVRRGYVDDPLHWRYSSMRNYAGREGLIKVATKW